MSRPTSLDELVAKRVVDAVRSGASRTSAAEAARVARSSLTLWLKRGAEGVEPYASFLIKVRQAEAELEMELVTIVKGHAVTTWGAACWLLERKFQRRWALRRDRLEREPAISEQDAEKLSRELAALYRENDAVADRGKAKD